MRGNVKAINFFSTTLASTINNTDTIGSFTITDKTVNGYTLEDGTYFCYLVVGLNNMSTYEIFRISNVDGTTLTFDKRISPVGLHEHLSGVPVVMNDFAELMNYVYDNVEDFGYCTETTGLNIKVNGGRMMYNGTEYNFSTQTIEVPDDDTTFIYLNYSNGDIDTADNTNVTGYILAKIVASSGAITLVEDRRHTYTGLAVDDTYLYFDNGKLRYKTTPISALIETINGNKTEQDPVEGTTTSYNGTCVVSTNSTTGLSTYYCPTGITTYDSEGNIVYQETKTGTYNESTGKMEYTDGDSVDSSTGIVEVNAGAFAFTNKDNAFLKSNTFFDSSIFKGKCAFPFYSITPDGSYHIPFNCNNGLTQKVTVASTNGYTVDLTNASPGAYILFVSKDDGGTCNLAFGSAGPSPVSSFYKDSSLTFPMSITTGVWIFTLLIAENAVHIFYSGHTVSY